ncbi:class I SAM-dependent methyltransferase [Inquilinus sp. CA228]|uniref:class I SAM-dependent methyltransferase n=1 Tax=Inquilinus sp. CA228 TaxID=3455609 RepID=UPI003F8D2E4F
MIRLTNRATIAQACLNRLASSVYLEIGVFTGSCFSRIAANRKIAVDPRFRVSRRRRARSESRADQTDFFEMRSDDFFAQNEGLLSEHPIDVALVDGLHTYEQTLRDIENVLRFQRGSGVIVVHDCNPKWESVGYPARDYKDFRKRYPLRFAWSGDVWKAIVHLRSTRPDLDVTVLDCDWGVGLIKHGQAEPRLDYSPEQIESLSYADLARDRARLLNLKSPGYLPEFLAA